MNDELYTMVTILEERNGIMKDIKPCKVTRMGSALHVDLGDGVGIEFMANSMINAVAHLFPEQEAER